ncbi:MAG: FHA domain-containing protein, partial [Kofleriaceae bacterium]
MASSKLSLAFRIYKHDQLIREARLTQGVIKIGKVPSAHLMIDDESVSRMHAIVEVTGGEVSIVDLGSTRGTLVNGRKVTKARLSSGDSIAVGDVRVEVVFHDSSAETLYVAPELAARPLDRAPDPAVFQAAIAESAEEPGGARAVEVAAMFGDSVIGVKHCIDPRGGKVASATWGVLGAGIALLAASAIAFYVSIDTAATNRAGLDHHTRVLHKPAYSYRPHQLGLAVDWIAFGGLALGLAGVAAGLARVHRERQSPFYRIGTAPGVEQPVEQAPSPSFPLVAPVGDAFVLNYAPGIDGELVAGGQTTPLSELAASGLARPSASVPGALELPIPPRARIRARAGPTTFLV